LAAYLTRFFRGRKILAVVGMMKDKDVVRYAENVAPCLSAVVATRSKNGRSASPEEISAVFGRFGVPTVGMDSDPVGALKHARALLPGYDMLLICGSLYLAGDVYDSLDLTKS
nr:hypothetical protein [Clostridia bacterium]